MSDRKGRGLLVAVAAVLTAGAVALAATGRLVFVGSKAWLGFVRGGWTDLWFPFAYFAVFLGVVLALIRSVDRMRRWAVACALAGVVTLAYLMHLATAFVAPAGLAEAVPALAVRRTNVFYDNARTIRSLEEYLADYKAHVRDAEEFAAKTHPPGPEIFYYLLRSLYQSAPWLREGVIGVAELAGYSRGDLATREVAELLDRGGVRGDEVDVAAAVAFTLKLLACLAVVPAYLLGAAVCSRRAGLIAAAFVAVVPAVHLFSPGLDQTYPAWAGLLCWLALVTVRAAPERPGTAAGAGLLFGLLFGTAMLFSVAFLAVLGLVAVVSVAALTRLETDPHAARTAWRCMGAYLCAVLGFTAVLLVFGAAWNVNLLEEWGRCLRANAAFNAAAGRPYWLSLVSNPAEWGVFLGLPLTVAWVSALVRSWRVRRSAWLPAVPILCFAGLMAVLDVSGVNRGEVARLWMFTAPLCAAAGAWWLEQRRWGAWGVGALLAVQFAQVACFRAALDALRLYSPA